MRWLLLTLVMLLGLFQFQLWFGENGLRQQAELQARIEQQMLENAKLEARNQQLIGAVAGLKDGAEGLEERARYDLGMVREGETFYMVIDDAHNSTQNLAQNPVQYDVDEKLQTRVHNDVHNSDQISEVGKVDMGDKVDMNDRGTQP